MLLVETDGARLEARRLSARPRQNQFHQLLELWGRDSSVGIATRYGLDGPGIESRWEARFYATIQSGLGAHPTSYTMGTESFPGGITARTWR